MSALPEVPDEAVEAGADALAYPRPVGDAQIHRALLVLDAAWPLLYAAALRHAADDPTGDPVLQRLTRSWLRRLADEAEKIGGGVSEESP